MSATQVTLRSLGDVRGGEDPAGVADRGDERALVVHLAHEIDHRLVAAHVLRGEAAGDDDGVEVGRVDIADREVGLHRVAELARIGLLGRGPTTRTLAPSSRSRSSGYQSSSSWYMILRQHGDLGFGEVHTSISFSRLRVHCGRDASVGRMRATAAILWSRRGGQRRLRRAAPARCSHALLGRIAQEACGTRRCPRSRTLAAGDHHARRSRPARVCRERDVRHHRIAKEAVGGLAPSTPITGRPHRLRAGAAPGTRTRAPENHGKTKHTDFLAMHDSVRLAA